MACAWQPPATRPVLVSLFAFDAHLGKLVAKANTPLLAQMRLAWWREQLREPAPVCALGDPILAGLAAHWQGSECVLLGLVDGWEELLAEPPLAPRSLRRFAVARGACLTAFATRTDAAKWRDQVRRAGERWALADFAFRTSQPGERDEALGAARAISAGGRLPASMRGIAVLAAIVDRAIAREEPLAQGRAAALVAMRLGIFGR